MQRTTLIEHFMEQFFEDLSDAGMVVGLNTNKRGRWYPVVYYYLDGDWRGGAITNKRYERKENARKFLLAFLSKA